MQLSELTWPKIDSLDRNVPFVIPVAAVEQHGHHLPLITDSMLLGEIVRRVDQTVGENVLFAPLLWLGNSDHHLDFVGTLSSPPRTYLDLLVGLLENAVHHGFKRIWILNGHGGNDVPGKQAIFETRQKHRSRSDLLLLFSTYWSLAETPPETGLEVFHQHEMGHACEWETSMMLRIAPHLVGNYREAEPVPPGNAFLPAARGWTTKDRTATGHIGWPHLASVEKGEHLLQTFSAGVQSMLGRMSVWDGQSWEG